MSTIAEFEETKPFTASRFLWVRLSIYISQILTWVLKLWPTATSSLEPGLNRLEHAAATCTSFSSARGCNESKCSMALWLKICMKSFWTKVTLYSSCWKANAIRGWLSTKWIIMNHNESMTINDHQPTICWSPGPQKKNCPPGCARALPSHKS